ncbi:MAG: hypothetical protein Q8L65_17390 [Burkholderiales bacterium]|jgi:hypothetical protein|nr:hypothetical protein [Burkholderiales bacterium]
MNSISYLRTEKRSQGMVVERFAPAMAVVLPGIPGLQPDPGPSGRSAVAGATAPGNQVSRS